MHDMHESGPRQNEIIARFLHTARIHFGLDTPERKHPEQPRPDRPPRRGRARQRLFRSLLVAGSIGGLFSGASFAAPSDSAADEARLDREVAEATPAVTACASHRRDGEA